MNKTAVCISGYFNSQKDLTSKGVDGYDHLDKHVFSKVDTDVYIHSWDLENKQQILDLYGDRLKGCLFQPQIDFEPISTLPKPDGRVPQSVLFSQFYSLQRSFELLNLSNEQYDCVIKTRFDVGRINRNTSGPHNPSNPYPVQCINFNTDFDMSKFYMANWQYLDTEGPADMWFYSNKENMANFAKIFDILSADVKIGTDYQKWAGESDGGLVNTIKAWKWFMLKTELWNKKVPLETIWE